MAIDKWNARTYHSGVSVLPGLKWLLGLYKLFKIWNIGTKKILFSSDTESFWRISINETLENSVGITTLQHIKFPSPFGLQIQCLADKSVLYNRHIRALVIHWYWKTTCSSTLWFTVFWCFYYWIVWFQRSYTWGWQSLSCSNIPILGILLQYKAMEIFWYSTCY